MAKRAQGGRRQEGRMIPAAPVERLIRRVGADRVSMGAAVALAEVLENAGLSIAARASRIAKHAGRKTVTAPDIDMAKN